MPADRQYSDAAWFSQGAIVHELLRDDHPERWSLKQLARALPDITPTVIAEAVSELEEAGVVWRLDEFVGASRCTRHLFALDIVCI